jgi:hypothetical protein
MLDIANMRIMSAAEAFCDKQGGVVLLIGNSWQYGNTEILTTSNNGALFLTICNKISGFSTAETSFTLIHNQLAQKKWEP